MKIRDLSFLLKAFGREDLHHFYEALEYRLLKLSARETCENDYITGYTIRILMRILEMVIPKYHRITHISRSDRKKFQKLIRERIDDLNKKRGCILSIEEKQKIQLNMMTLKFMYVLSEQDDFFR